MSGPLRPSFQSPLTPALLAVVRGRPTPEELAAVAAVLIASARLADGREGGPARGTRSGARWTRSSPEDGPAPSWTTPADRHTWR